MSTTSSLANDTTSYSSIFLTLEEYISEDPKLGLTDYQCNDSTVINLLLVGRNQLENYIFLESFINPRQTAKSYTFSESNHFDIRTFIVTETKTNLKYTINVVYLPNLPQSQNVEEIFELLRLCITNKISYINAVLYVSTAGQTHALDIEVFKIIQNFLGKSFSKNSLLILNHSEELSKQRYEHVLLDMNKYKETRDLIEYCSLGVFPYITIKTDLTNDDEVNDEGCNDEEKNNSTLLTLKIKTIRKSLTKIEAMRQNLFRTIIKTTETCQHCFNIVGLEILRQKEQQRAIDNALNVEKLNWEKQIEEHIKKYNDYFLQIQEEMSKSMENKMQIIHQENDRRYIELRKQFREEVNELQTKYKKYFEEENERQRAINERQLVSLKIDKEQKETVRLNTERAEKEARERQQKLDAEVQSRILKEDEELCKQQQRIAEEVNKRLMAEFTKETLLKRVEYERRQREEYEREQKTANCFIL